VTGPRLTWTGSVRTARCAGTFLIWVVRACYELFVRSWRGRAGESYVGP
jgi:hypothetical protein